jgi:hypothetical protein
MLPTILKSERFQQEYKKYQSMIDELPDGALKTEMDQLLTKLVREIKSLDNGHLDMIMSRQIPVMAPDIRERITSLRRQLDRKYQDWRSANR